MGNHIIQTSREPSENRYKFMPCGRKQNIQDRQLQLSPAVKQIKPSAVASRFEVTRGKS